MMVEKYSIYEIINVFRKVEDCENKYARDLGDNLLHKYYEQLKISLIMKMVFNNIYKSV